MESPLNNTPPPPLNFKILIEEINRFKNVSQQVIDWKNLLSIAEKDYEFSLFSRRFQMAEMLSKLPSEELKNLPLKDLYLDFWRLVRESQHPMKFSEEEKNISQKFLEQAKQEKDPNKRQYIALALILFGELQAAQGLIDQNLLPYQLKEDLTNFLKWEQTVGNPISMKLRESIVHNEQTLISLQDKYAELIKKHSQDVINKETCPYVEDYQIYFCWLQGEENLPPIVRCCYNSLKENAGHYKVVFIDEKNFSNYVDIAPHVMDKFRAGKISRTHFSDILRINLLERHGGLWLDATILVTEPLENHKDLLESHYFTQRFHKEKSYRNAWAAHITFGRWASFIQGTSVIHNPLFAFEKELLNEYLHDFDKFGHYFLMDFMMALAYDNIPVVTKIFDDVPINNKEIYFIQNHMNDSYRSSQINRIFANTFLHKLSWKNQVDMTREDTIFREIERRYAPETAT